MICILFPFDLLNKIVPRQNRTFNEQRLRIETPWAEFTACGKQGIGEEVAPRDADLETHGKGPGRWR